MSSVFFLFFHFFVFFPLLCAIGHMESWAYFLKLQNWSSLPISPLVICVYKCEIHTQYPFLLLSYDLEWWNIVLHNIAIYIVQPHPIAKFAIVKRLSVDQLVKLVWLNCGLCPIKSYTKWTLYWFTTRLLQFECLLTVNTSASRSLLAHSDSTNMLMLKLLLSISQSIYL